MRTGLHGQAGLRGDEEGGRAAVVLVGALALRRAHDVHLRAVANFRMQGSGVQQLWVQLHLEVSPRGMLRA